MTCDGKTLYVTDADLRGIALGSGSDDTDENWRASRATHATSEWTADNESGYAMTLSTLGTVWLAMGNADSLQWAQGYSWDYPQAEPK